MKTRYNSKDPFGELSGAEKIPGLKQRFPDRVLIMTTDRCYARCPHCTRKWILGKSPVVDTPAKLSACVEYVRRHPQVRDVLLSGGDVLTLSDVQVKRLVDTFAAMKQIEVIRICTRALVANPKRITSALVKILAKSRKVWVNCHINTADEVSRCRKAAAKLIDAGIPVSSQTVLLRGVNDSRMTMMALLKSLTAARIRPYYVFQCDPVEGLDHFRVPLAKAKQLESYCAEHLGGLSLPRFVADLPGFRRKMPLSMLKD